MTRRLALVALSAVTLLSAPAGPLSAAFSELPKLDVGLRWALTAPARLARLPGAEQPGSALPVLVRFRRSPGQSNLEELERAGLLEGRRSDGHVLGATTVFLARVVPEAVDRLVARPEVERVELAWRVGGQPPLDLTAPLSTVDLVWATLDDEGRPLDGSGVVIADASSAGTRMLAFRLEAAPALGSGSWRWVFTNSSADDLTVDAFKLDDLSGWAGHSVFLDPPDEGTVTFPATAHHVVVVGGYSGRPGTDTPMGQLNSFSGRGPALDGRRLVDLVAPGSATYSAADGSRFGTLGPWDRFGGTSAATPHVAGTVALLLQAEPTATPEQVERALERGARADEDTGVVPNPDYGYGKLDAAAALEELHRIVAEEHSVHGETGTPRRPAGRLGPPTP